MWVGPLPPGSGGEVEVPLVILDLKGDGRVGADQPHHGCSCVGVLLHVLKSLKDVRLDNKNLAARPFNAGLCRFTGDPLVTSGVRFSRPAPEAPFRQ